HTIGSSGVDAAMQCEYPGNVSRCEIGEKTVVVIAKQRNHAFVPFRCVDQETQHVLRFRTAIDIVTQMNDAPVVDRTAIKVGANEPMHVLQQVETAMHVANGVNPDPVRSFRILENHAHSSSSSFMSLPVLMPAL